MSQQKVVLALDKTLTKLAGNQFGRKLFETQIQDVIDLDKPFVIEIPEQVDYLATSFVQGFFGEIYKKIGPDGIDKNLNIIARSIQNAKESIMDKLMIM